MDLLTAVNTVLPYLAEHKVTSVQGAKHPVVDLIIDAIERNRYNLLAEGKYFNTAKDIVLQPNAEGRIAIPDNALDVFCNYKPVRFEDGYLYDISKDTWYFTESITVTLYRDVDFQNLPQYAASYIVYKSAYEVYVASFGIDNTSSALASLGEENRRKLSQQELRNKQYNSRVASSYSYQYRLRRR